MRTASNILHLGIKELRSLYRDPIMLALIVWAFSFAVYTAATAVPDTLSRATIAITDEDRSPLSTRISSAFYLPYFVPPELIDRAQTDERMDAGRSTFALDIPPSFQRDLLARRRPTIQLNVDATTITQAFTGSGYIQSIVSGEVNAFLRRYRATEQLPVDLALRVRYNPQLSRSWFYSVVEVINQVTLLSVTLTGAALIREREHGTLEHLLVMPLTPFEIMAAKVWSMALVVLVACGLSLTLVVQGLLGVPFQYQGAVPLFLAGAAVNLFATTSMGIFLGTVARSMPQFGLLVILVIVPLQMLSGGFTPRESMPEFVQIVMLAAPTTHFVSLAQAILFRGAGLSVVWPQLLAMGVIGACLFGYALTRLRRTLSAAT
ncbi:ABC transporter permease [Roseomonas eburnea]|uniref:ABC transporter permease n=1 Tax=Neoroseomonas eburnea TaxID=1346889 RepID=A0A9X9XJG9_9PROT|nr:ABC transporter permease [Neoroseomonas eburnea]MBR0683855.1 ABC transporter permease [Neoroseomonas eburnea]